MLPSSTVVIDDLISRCTFPPAGTTVTCALSGGPDSAALVALAVHADLDVTAVHVDHGLRASSSVDVAAAERIADRLGVAVRIERASIDHGSNLEARARTARHALIGPEAMWGHTADDQAETVLLALLRGSGSTGVSAIAPGHRHPILALRRTDTHALCTHLGLDPVLDPTNADPRFLRNRVRDELLPLMADLARRDVAPLLARTADLVRDDDRLLDEQAESIDPTDARALAMAPVSLARRAVRQWLTVDGYPPDSAGVERVLDVARGVDVACEVAGVGRIERSHQTLRRA